MTIKTFDWCVCVSSTQYEIIFFFSSPCDNSFAAFPHCITGITSRFTQSDENDSHHPDFTDKSDHAQPLGTVWDFLDGARSPGLWVTNLKVPGQHKRNTVYLNILPCPIGGLKYQDNLGGNLQSFCCCCVMMFRKLWEVLNFPVSWYMYKSQEFFKKE